MMNMTIKKMQHLILVCCIGTMWLACTSTNGKDPKSKSVSNTDNSYSQDTNPSYHETMGDGFILMKNWDFGADDTIRNMSDMNNEFVYHDQFGTVANGTNYGAITLASDSDNALSSTPTGPQPIEYPDKKVREFTAHSLRTYLVPLNGADTCLPTRHDVGCGSFMAKWKLDNAGSRLGKDILWETRVRYVTPPYFWFAIWNAGIKWNQGAEIDLVESFGYDNGGGKTNFDGRFWHSNSIGGPDQVKYNEWNEGMAASGIKSFDGSQYHIWQLLYRKDNSYSCYVDGIEVQKGNLYHWTLRHQANGEPLDFYFLFDAGWGHVQIASVNNLLPASAFEGKFYEWDYSRVFLR